MSLVLFVEYSSSNGALPATYLPTDNFYGLESAQSSSRDMAALETDDVNDYTPLFQTDHLKQ